MEVTNNVPVFRSFHQRDLSRDFQEDIPYSNLNSKCAFLFKNQSLNVKKDALYAVKLDPAVLEAQVTLRAPQEGCREERNNTITSVSSNDENEANSDTASSIQLNDEFKTVLSMQRAALQSLSAQQFDLLLRYVDTLRKQRLSVQKQMECAFCKNNGHPIKWYSTHSLKDSKGRVRCPILRGYYCRRCGATGDHAHTIKYCTRSDLRS